MISRRELEELILHELVDVRRAESKLNGRMKGLTSSGKAARTKVGLSVEDLKLRVGRLELMLDALDRSNDFAHSAAA